MFLKIPVNGQRNNRTRLGYDSLVGTVRQGIVNDYYYVKGSSRKCGQHA